MPPRLIILAPSSWGKRFNSTQAAAAKPLLNIINGNVYQFGSVNPVHKEPLDWTMQDDPKEAWAILGDGKHVLFDVCEMLVALSSWPGSDV